MKGRHKPEDQETTSSNQPNAAGQDSVEKDITDLLQKLSDERDALRDQLLRTMADFQNFRKRQDDQRRQLELFANERLVTCLLPVLDNFERALTSFQAGSSAEALVEG